VLPRPKKELAAVVRELRGNDGAILEKAESLFNGSQPQLALETLDLILKVDGNHVPARQLRVKILEKLAESDICLISRNVWTCYRDEDREFLKHHFLEWILSWYCCLLAMA